VIRLSSVEGENFRQFPSFKLKLSKLGLVWLGGDNRDSEGAESNGSGKSNLLQAFGWCFFGETTDDFPADDVIREGEAKASVTIKTDCGWRFTRERRVGSPSFKVFFKEEQLKLPRAELQAKVTEVIGYDWQGWLNAVHYADNDQKRFIRPKTNDADRKAILHRFLRTEDVSEAHAFIKADAKEVKTKLDEAEVQKREATAALAVIDVEALQDRFNGFDEAREAEAEAMLEDARKLAKRAKAEVARLHAKRAEVETLKTQRKQLKKALAEADEVAAEAKRLKALVDRLYEKSLQATNDRNEATLLVADRAKKLQRLSDEECPVCTSSLSSGKAAKFVAKAKAEHELAKKYCAETEVTYEATKKTHQVVFKKLQAAERLLELRSELENSLATVRAGIAAALVPEDGLARDLIKQSREREVEAEKIRKRPNPFKDDVESAKQHQKVEQAKLETAKKAITDLSYELAHYEFWRRGYSPSGFPSYMLDSVMPFLTERTNHYLETLSDGDITVEFSTQKELGSTKGEFRDEIGITWEIEGVAKKNPSGGQWGKMEIANDLALMDLATQGEGSNVDLLILDEVLDGLDSIGRQRLMLLLHELRSVRGTIFVVSHDADIAEVFEHSVTVIKKNGASHLKLR
jgi:DNA repair exonuclease SbcCD ATPase subunit